MGRMADGMAHHTERPATTSTTRTRITSFHTIHESAVRSTLAAAFHWQYGRGMARTLKMTFTSDEQERRRMLKVFDDVVERIPLRPVKTADAELLAVRRARRQGGRRTTSSAAK